MLFRSTPSTSTTTGALQVSGGAGIAANVNVGGNLSVTGNVVGGGVRSTSSATPPSNPVVGDMWYYTTTDTLYRYTTDGTTNVWVDISGPTILAT